MRPRKYHVTLTQEDSHQLLQLIKSGKSQAYKITHAQVLLKLDECFNEKVTKAYVQKLLKDSDIKPFKIKYYCEKRDPEFESKMHEVLLVYN